MPNEKLILVVDDEVEIRTLMEDFLVAHGYRVVTAADGQEALRLAGAHVPDLVIADLLLPGEHGLEVIRSIKDDYFIPVIAMSGVYKPHEITQELDDFYLDGFFTKPLDMEGMLGRIRAVLHA
jgi:DNA-binding response OmpR family regulator